MNTEEQNNTHRSYFFKKLFENPNVSVLYGVRGVSQIKFTMSDSFLVLYDFGILSMIKRKLKSFWFLLCQFDFKFVVFDFSNAFLISKIWHVWFPKFVAGVWFAKWHFWFPKFIGFDFSNNTFDFQNLSRLISQMTLLISEGLISQITLSISKMRQIWMIFTWQFCGW